MSSLYGITQNLSYLDHAITQAIEDDTPYDDISAMLAEHLSTEADFQQKVEAYCSYIADLQALADARAAEAKRIAALAQATASKAQTLKDALKHSLTVLSRNKVETDRFSVRVQRAGGKVPLILDETAVPGEWTTSKVVVSPDKEKIRAALEAGECLEFASLGERGNVLIIR